MCVGTLLLTFFFNTLKTNKKIIEKLRKTLSTHLTWITIFVYFTFVIVDKITTKMIGHFVYNVSIQIIQTWRKFEKILTVFWWFIKLLFFFSQVPKGLVTRSTIYFILSITKKYPKIIYCKFFFIDVYIKTSCQYLWFIL